MLAGVPCEPGLDRREHHARVEAASSAVAEASMTESPTAVTWPPATRGCPPAKPMDPAGLRWLTGAG